MFIYHGLGYMVKLFWMLIETEMATNSIDIYKTYNHVSPQITENRCYVILGHVLIATTFETEIYIWSSSWISYIVVVIFIAGGNPRTPRKPPTGRKSLTNFSTWYCTPGPGRDSSSQWSFWDSLSSKACKNVPSVPAFDLVYTIHWPDCIEDISTGVMHETVQS